MCSSAAFHAFLGGIKLGEFDALLRGPALPAPTESTSSDAGPAPKERTSRGTELAARSAKRLAGWGARLAGRRRGHLREAWLGELANAVEDGNITATQAWSTGFGYVLCALKLRAQDLHAACLGVASRVVISAKRTHMLIATLVGIAVFRIFSAQGLNGVINNLVNFGIAWTALAAGAKRLRDRLSQAKAKPPGRQDENSR
jgi:hypothetical protein